MLEKAFIQEYKKNLEKEVQNEYEYIGSHRAEDYPERVGVIRGLKSSLSLFEDLLRTFYPD